MNSLFSIVIPVYNVMPYLVSMIKSTIVFTLESSVCIALLRIMYGSYVGILFNKMTNYSTTGITGAIINQI